MIAEKFVCRNCGGEISLSESHREFLFGHGCDRPPFYCAGCFAERLRQICEMPGEKRIAICSVCGKQTRLCFIPCQDRPVFCPQCFRQQKEGEIVE